MARGSYACIVLGTSDLAGTFERVQASGADVVQEPADQPYGIRDCPFRDPAGNLVASTNSWSPAPEPSHSVRPGAAAASAAPSPAGDAAVRDRRRNEPGRRGMARGAHRAQSQSGVWTGLAVAA